MDHVVSQLNELYIEGRAFSAHRGRIRRIELGTAAAELFV